MVFVCVTISTITNLASLSSERDKLISIIKKPVKVSLVKDL